MTRKPEQTKVYEVRVQRTITYATESATLRVHATNQEEAKSIARSLYDEGKVTLSELEIQDCEVYCDAEELTDKARIDTLLRVIRDISAETVPTSVGATELSHEAVANIQGLCRLAIELEQQVVKK